MKKYIKVYDAMFPLWWLLFLIPQMWLFVLPGNFIIDSIVLFISMALMKIQPKWSFYKKYILKIFLFGLLSDIIGSILAFILAISLSMFALARLGDEPYITIPALILSGSLIFLFNYYKTFKMLDKPVRIRLSLVFAVFTAPYTFLIPSGWLYS